MTTDSTDMVVAPRAGAIIPRTLDDVARMAKMAHASGLVKVASPEAAGVILLTGAELGLSPMQALRGIYVVDGKPTLSADLMVAIVKRADVCQWWRTAESTPETCTIETQRRGDPAPSRRTWTIADAQRAGLTGRQPWRQYPATMLRHRCAADLAREVYPDVVLGLYDPEELDSGERVEQEAHGPVETPRVVIEPDPAPPVDPERYAIEQETPAELHVALEDFYARVAEIELPGEAVPVWMKHRSEVGKLKEADREAAWKAICKRTEEVGKMKNARVWLKKAVAEEDARRSVAPVAQS